MSNTNAVEPLAIDLALQGGGSHGAFTWGVLDALLEDGSLRFSGISGTSAGALNAAVLATGLARGGNAGAREALHAFWADVARAGRCFGALQPPALPGWTAPAGVPAWGWTPADWLGSWARSFSPYQLNPFGLNPLRDVVARHVDVAALQSGPPALFVIATAVHTGQPRVFTGAALTLDALMASTCLPHLFRAVEIDGEPYWDGGYVGNPALWPLIYETPEADLLLVKIDPLKRPATPRTALAIADRVSEIGFNSALVGEMRAIAFVQRLLAEERIERGRYKELRLHMIADEGELATLDAASKLDTRASFLESLFGMGRAAAQRWLAGHRADVGVRSSLDIEATFLAPR
ncbi:patatin-like phospholipase family protein [Azohydromonas caseinilytica]|uniref:Patatin-like phospholipase family protein n=1 Tax=Azohydromonas caseinilytica TaxID=2728836 RepID=A0A848F7V3_9BURK|nr:patatin-like phospholipase family protein [Azohydromonas caseinilytica]NML14795.1 patatin-like phospholipase family protein [Azohydromonas caseinilytica]